jgi:hypothetical protein
MTEFGGGKSVARASLLNSIKELRYERKRLRPRLLIALRIT